VRLRRLRLRAGRSRLLWGMLVVVPFGLSLGVPNTVRKRIANSFEVRGSATKYLALPNFGKLMKIHIWR
jgi:hypothetical protein